MKTLFTIALALFTFLSFGQKWTADLLKNKLVDDIAGFSAVDKARGETFTTDEIKYTSATREYRNGESTLEVQIFDYSAAASIYQSLTSIWGSNMSYENEDEKATSTKIAGHPGWEIIHKTQNTVSLLVGINNSLYISINAQDATKPELIRKVAESLVSKF